MVKYLFLFYTLFFTVLSANGSDYKVQSAREKKDRKYTYDVKVSTQSTDINSNWEKEFWNNVKAVNLKNHMGDKPSHFPGTQMKLKYDKDYIYVIFRVKDHYIRAVAKKTNGKVYEDSCVEFFFTPVPDVSRGYFNMETNCKGIFLLEFHKNNGQEKGFVDLKDANEIEISHSLEKNVENEISEPLIWTVEYKIPLSILSKYMEVDKPEPGVHWRANFYKCGDKTSHPHWLTWAPVDFPQPKFHLPEFFGHLEFN